MATKVGETFLAVRGLSIGFVPKKPINQRPWSFDLEKSKIIGLVGPNGSGKTTLMRTLLGDLPPLKGQVHVAGFNSSPHHWKPKEVSQIFSYLPQEALFDSMQFVQDHISLAFLPELGLFGRVSHEQKDRLEEMLSCLRLTSFRFRRLGELSTGEKQRVFLARVMLQKTACILLDEPTNHLDWDSIGKCWGLLEQARENKKLVLVASHDLEQIKTHCQMVLQIENGQLSSQLH